MGITMKNIMAVIYSLMLVFTSYSHADVGKKVKYTPSSTKTYSQKILLKNWALSSCLARIAVDEKDRADASATGSAYLEYGKQSIEAYGMLQELAKQYADRKYGSSIGSELNTMKCIDLFHSKDLERLVDKILKDPSLN